MDKTKLIELLSEFATEVLILDELHEEVEKFEKEELKLKRAYATKINKLK